MSSFEVQLGLLIAIGLLFVIQASEQSRKLGKSHRRAPARGPEFSRSPVAAMKPNSKR